MKAPSRTMPLYKAPRTSLVAWLVISFLAVGLLVLVWKYPWWSLILPFFAVMCWDAGRRDKRRIAGLLEGRNDESICTFARSFDTSFVDTWVIRAVYKEVQSVLGTNWHQVPIRADDRLKEDLEMDDDDIDLDLVDIVSQRTGRSMEGYEQNPLYSRVETVRDLVMFFNAQPLQDSTAQRK